MAETASMTLALSPELLAKLEGYADRNQRSAQEVAEEALRTFLDDENFTDIRRYHALRAESMGLTLDDYVVALVKEHRREARGQQAA